MKLAIPTNRTFGLLWAGLCLTIAIMGRVIFAESMFSLFTVAGLFFVLALAKPIWLMPLNRLWGHFALRLGRVTNPLILGILFYLIISPVGLMLRLFGHDPLQRQIKTRQTTYFTKVYRQTNAETCQDLF